MHGPKIEHKRRQGEINAALACGGGTDQLSEEEAQRIERSLAGKVPERVAESI
jgi:hypothetical protein